MMTLLADPVGEEIEEVGTNEALLADLVGAVGKETEEVVGVVKEMGGMVVGWLMRLVGILSSWNVASEVVVVEGELVKWWEEMNTGVRNGIATLVKWSKRKGETGNLGKIVLRCLANMKTTGAEDLKEHILLVNANMTAKTCLRSYGFKSLKGLRSHVWKSKGYEDCGECLSNETFMLALLLRVISSARIAQVK